MLQGTGGFPHCPLGWGEGGLPQLWPCVPPQLSEPRGFPGFLLFLCRLLSPILQTYGRAVEFLERRPWPQPGRTSPKWGTPRDSLGPLRHSWSPQELGSDAPPTAEADYVEALLEFLAEDEDGE